MIKYLTKLNNLQIIGAALIFWIGSDILAATLFQNLGYVLHIFYCLSAPAGLIILMGVLDIIRHKQSGKPIWFGIFVPYCVILSYVGWRGLGYYRAYMSMRDTPRGILWEIYIIDSLVAGLLIFWTVFCCCWLLRKILYR